MQNITVSKRDLIEKVRTNREEHRAIFLAAQEKYREKVIDLLDKRLADARDGRPIVLTFGLPEPVDYSGEYDAALDALAWEQADSVVLDEDTFRRLVRNEWSWARHFAANSMSYLAE
jgi:hypothetical protein